MNFLQKRFVKAVLQEDFRWLDNILKTLDGHLMVNHVVSFTQMELEIVNFIDGKKDKVSQETAEFASAFLVYDAKYLEQISKKVGPRFVVWILSRLLLLGSKPAWEVLLHFEKQLSSGI